MKEKETPLVTPLVTSNGKKKKRKGVSNSLSRRGGKEKGTLT